MARKTIKLSLHLKEESSAGTIASIKNLVDKIPNLGHQKTVMNFYEYVNDPGAIVTRTRNNEFFSSGSISKLLKDLENFGHKHPGSRSNGTLSFYYTRPITEKETNIEKEEEEKKRKKMKSKLRAKINELKSLGVKIPRREEPGD